MWLIARFVGVGILLSACTADPLGGGGEERLGEGHAGSTSAVKPGGTQENIAITGQGTDGEVVGCSGSDACQWRFEGTATGSPLDGTITIVALIETTGTWDNEGCQSISSGSVRFFRKEKHKHGIGWMLQLSGTYCTTGSHSGTGTFTVHPETPPGQHKNATGSGVFSFTDGVGNNPGNTGPWEVQLAGVAEF